MNRSAAQLRIEGRVQGVGFRYSAVRAAARYNVKGWVRNEFDGSVSAYCEGKDSDVESFIQWCRKGPPSAHVTNTSVKKLPFRGVYSRFQIEY